MTSQSHLASFLLLSWKKLLVQGAQVLFGQEMEFPTGITLHAVYEGACFLTALQQIVFKLSNFC